MKRLLTGAGIAGAVLVGIDFGLPFLFDANRFRPALEASMSQALGRKVAVGNLKLSLLSGGVRGEYLTILDDPAFGQTPFVTADSFVIGVDLSALFFSGKLAAALTIDQPRMWLLQSPAGEWNFS